MRADPPRAVRVLRERKMEAKKLAAIGRNEEMLAFGCVGVTAYCARDGKEAAEILGKLGDCAVVFVSEKLFAELDCNAGRGSDLFPIVLSVPAL